MNAAQLRGPKVPGDYITFKDKIENHAAPIPLFSPPLPASEVISRPGFFFLRHLNPFASVELLLLDSVRQGQEGCQAKEILQGKTIHFKLQLSH